MPKNVVQILVISLLLSGWSLSVSALEVRLDKYLPYIEVLHEGNKVRVQRNQDQNHTISGGFAKTSRQCPPFCVQPMQVAPGIETVGELELFQFMEVEVNAGSGILIDARLPNWHKKGTIPGSINIPFTVFNLAEDDPQLEKAMNRIGGIRKKEGSDEGMMEKLKQMVGDKKDTGPWDFSEAKNIVLWCNGMWCGQSPRAIHALLKHHFPPEKLKYYRGGMQSWRILGLTVVVPGK